MSGWDEIGNGTGFTDPLAGHWDEIGQHLRANLLREPTDDEVNEFRTQWEQQLAVTKYGTTMWVPTETLIDEGLIPDTRPARPHRAPVRVTSWTLARDLARTRVRATINAGRLRAGSWIAGVQLAEYDGDETETDWCDDEDDW